MRIISQDGTISINFDFTNLFCREGYIYAELNNKHVSIGKFKEEKRAIDVFSELHTEWLAEITSDMHSSIYIIPKE